MILDVKDKLNKMDMLNLLELLSQIEGIGLASGKRVTEEFVNLKLKLERNILNA